MNDKEVKAWCYEIWPKHWRELAPSSNSRALFYKEVLKLSPDSDELQRIGNAIIEQTKFWRLKSKREKVYGIPRLSQWIKDCRYDDVFITESFVDISQDLDKKLCCICALPVHGPNYDKCTDCFHQFHADTWKAQRETVLKGLGIYQDGMSLKELADHCRRFLKDKSFKIKDMGEI